MVVLSVLKEILTDQPSHFETCNALIVHHMVSPTFDRYLRFRHFIRNNQICTVQYVPAQRPLISVYLSASLLIMNIERVIRDKNTLRGFSPASLRTFDSRKEDRHCSRRRVVSV